MVIEWSTLLETALNCNMTPFGNYRVVSPHGVINRNTTYNFLCVTARACDEAFFSFTNVESLFVDF